MKNNSLLIKALLYLTSYSQTSPSEIVARGKEDSNYINPEGYVSRPLQAIRYTMIQQHFHGLKHHDMDLMPI